ncbi:MAG: hypothetical protein OQK09_11535 [Colwellia sp.]|nr:hypothetical protein [Colwellia sp.]MCW9082135.1 hypothetical protein [Colwellia sp.]
MDNWLAILIIVIAVVLIIGNFSTFQKSSHQKLRKTNLNDLKETLPRSQKTTHKMPTIDKEKLK